MYVYVWIYAISVYTFRYIYRQKYMSLYRQTCIYVHTYTYYMNAYTHVDVCMYIGIHVCRQTIMDIYISACMSQKYTY